MLDRRRDEGADTEALRNGAVVRIDRVEKWFGENHVLRGVDLEVREREVVCVIGRSGSGKTTLLRCINHLETLDAGRIWVDGALVGYRQRGSLLHELDDRAQARQRRDIGMVFQQFHLFPHRTVLENVTEGPLRVLRRPKKEVLEEGRSLLATVGLAEKERAYPLELSGGQQQRVAIARALAMKPKVMLFDEPTSSLDPELVGEVLDVMRMLADGGMTMIVVTHEMGFARDAASTLVFMHEGTIAELGSPPKLFGNPQHPALRQFLARELRWEAG